MVIISGLVFQIFAPESGIINVLRKRAGTSPSFLSDPTLWTCVYLFVGLCREPAGLDHLYGRHCRHQPELYEAAAIDGAGRLRKIWHITLPGISSTIVILLIMRMGSMVSIGFEKPYLLGNTYVKEASDVISTYVYRMGLESSNYEIATAVGLMQSAIGMVLLLLSNAIANSVNGSGIF
jgi:putative aldouronate transport system permease protein